MSEKTIEIEWSSKACELKMAIPPPVVGSMEILPDVFFHITRKPNWLHRIMAHLLLGWKWKDKT